MNKDGAVMPRALVLVALRADFKYGRRHSVLGFLRCLGGGGTSGSLVFLSPQN